MAITISGENNNDRILASDGVIDQISGINIVGLITASHINVGSNIQLGNAGIITATTFVGNVTGNVNSTSPLLLQTGGSERFRITGNNELGIAGANYGTSGQVLTSGGSGSAVSWVTPAVTAFTNGSNNRVVTATSGSGLNGEANLTYDGTNLQLITDANSEGIKSISNGNSYPIFELDSDRASSGNTIGKLVSKWNNTEVASIQFVSGDDSSNKDNASIYLNTRSGGSGNVLRLRITQDGQLGTTAIVRSAYGGLDLCSQGATNYGTLTLGAGGGQNGQSRNSNQENQFRIMMPTYADPSLMTTVLYGTSGTAGHDLFYGGGTGWAYATNTHRFFTTANQTTGNGTERIRITSGGNVNIGGDYSQTSYLTSITNTANTNLFRIKTANEGDYDLRFNIQNSEAMIWHYGTDDLVFGNRYDRKLSLITNAQKRLTIHGNFVGINETSPDTYVHIKGTGRMLRLETTASGGGQCYIDFNDETATRASIGMRGSSSDTLTLAALNGSMRFDVSGKTQAVNIDTAGRLLVNTTSSSISSSELFEVKSTSTGFSHFRNNSSSYAPIYIDNEATNNGSTLVPLITITDGGGNRAGFLMNNSSDFNISGQGSVSLSTGGTVGNATERLVVEPNSGIGKVKIQGEQSGGTTYGLEIIGNQQTNAVSGADAGARIIAPVARRMYFELRANDDTDHFAWLGNPDFDTGNADTILMELHPKGYLQKPLQPSFHVGSPNNSGSSSGQVWKSHSNAIYSNVGSHYDNSTGRFTAPVDGQYFFFHWGMTQSNSAGTTDVYSRKNGSRDQIGTSYNSNSGGTNGYHQFGCSYVRTLSAGDYVDVYTSNGSIYYTTDGRHGGWGGWLIG